MGKDQNRAYFNPKLYSKESASSAIDDCGSDTVVLSSRERDRQDRL